MCKNPQVEIDRPAVAELMADVAAAVARRSAAVSEDVYEAIVQQIPQLREDKPVLTLLASSVDSNVDTCLQIMQHRIDLAAVRAPAAATEYARRLAQRGTPLTALLRAYRLGHTRFSDWMIKELARQARDAEMISAATLGMSRVVAGYIDQTSEEMVAAYAQARENWLRKRSAAQAARIRDLLAGGRIDVGATEATLGYRLRQYHVGLVCWVGDAVSTADEISRLEQAVGHVAGKAVCPGDPVFLPRDESSAWAWLPMAHLRSGGGGRGGRGCPFRLRRRGAGGGGVPPDPPAGPRGPGRRAHHGSHTPQAVAFGEVAPIAMMLGSAELLRAWVLSTLAGLADDDEHHARLRETLLVFLQTGGSYKTTAEQLMLHKNTVQYRIRKARESLGRPVGDRRYEVELALQASRWLGSSVRQPAGGHDHDPRERAH